MSDGIQPRHLLDGDKAPDFEFLTADGRRLRSSDLLREGPVLLTFYRGAWCMCCQADLRDLMQAMSAIRKTGATVVGVFHDLAPGASQNITQEYGLDFPVVDDVDGHVAESFGVRRSPDEQALDDRDVPSVLQGGPWILPMQARFLIGKDGILARREIILDYSDRSNVCGLVPILERLA
jgi:peroxiredoxin